MIVPNAKIGQSDVVNYTYPETDYRLQIDLGVTYEADMEKVRQIIRAAVRIGRHQATLHDLCVAGENGERRRYGTI